MALSHEGRGHGAEGEENGLALLVREGVDALLVSTAGEQRTTPGFAERLRWERCYSIR